MMAADTLPEPAQMTDTLPIRRALLSVSDKTGIVPFAAFLAGIGVELVSTGGTARALREAGLAVRDVSDLSGFPEILDGRVKTLVPQVHGGLLARRDDPHHMAALAAYGIGPIDLVAVNLYPFEATVAERRGFDECVENIDIGGPALIRAAAKNHAFVAVLTAPEHLSELREEIAAKGGTTLATRRRLAAEAYARTAAYDAAIARWFANANDILFPPRAAFAGTLAQTLRYGENPHQKAAFYRTDTRPGVATAVQIQGKELSYNNIADTDAAYECAAEFDQPAIVIVKHANPCGVAVGPTLAAAWDRALACDPVSAFGGIVAANRTLDEAAAERIAAIFTEVVIAPDATESARAVFARKKNLRLLLAGGLPDPAAPGLVFRSVSGGFLAQTRDGGRLDTASFRVVTKRAPTDAERADLVFAFLVAKHVKSNAIVYAKNGATVGIGAGQMSRVDSARIAAWKSAEAAKTAGLAEPLAKGSVVASDAFFPASDGLISAAEAGATAVIQPGGSVRDAEVIAAADERGLAMVFTGIRHFRH